MPKRIKILTAVYILILAGIVALVNDKSTQYLLRFSGGIPYFDKIAHFLLMGGFSFLVNLVLKARFASIGKIRYLMGSMIVFLIVTVEELSQIFVSGRTFDIGDLAADYLGIVIFGELARFTYQKYLIRY